MPHRSSPLPRLAHSFISHFRNLKNTTSLWPLLLASGSAHALQIDQVDTRERFPETLASWTTTTSAEPGSFAAALNGTRVVVGLPTNNTDPGIVRVFDRVDEDGNFVQVGSDIVNHLTYAKFGASVAINEAGDRLAIGAPEAENPDTSGQNVGCVYFYKLINDVWISYGNPIWGSRNNQRFGKSLSFSDDGLRLAIGNGETSYSYISSVQVVQDSPLAYQPIGGPVMAAVAGDQFGASVHLSGDGQYLAVGAPHNTSAAGRPGSGYVRVFFLDENANYTESFAWSQVGSEFSYHLDNIKFGTSVTLNADGSRLAVGAPSAKTAFAYERTVSTWAGLQTFSVTDASNFGSQVSLSDNGHVLGVTSVYPNSNWVFVYREIEDWRGKRWISTPANRGTVSSNPLLIERSVAQGEVGLISPDGRGVSYKLSSTTGNTLGTIGSKALSNSGIAWPNDDPWRSFSEPLTGLNGDDLFGKNVALSADGNTLVVASPGAGLTGYSSNTGKIDIYSKSDSDAWQDLNFPTALSNLQSGEGIGSSIAISSSGTRVAVGSMSKVRVYERNGSSWILMGEVISALAPAASLSFSADGSRLAIGMPEAGAGASGIVEVRSWDGSSWQLLGSILRGDSNTGTSRQVGRKVCLNADGSRLATSHGGYVRIYQLSASGWGQLGNAIETASDEFQLSATGYKILIGIEGDNGSVVSYTLNQNGLWEPLGEALTTSYRSLNGVQSEENIGAAISISAYGDRVAIASVGAGSASLPSHNEPLITDAGLVRVFEQADDGSWSKFDSTIFGNTSNSGFGSSVALSADGLTLVIGAPTAVSDLQPKGTVLTHTMEANAAITHPTGLPSGISSLRWLRHGDLAVSDASYQYGVDYENIAYGPSDSLAMSEDGSRVALVDGAYNVRVYERRADGFNFSASRQIGATIDLDASIGRVCLSNNGQVLAIATKNFIEIRGYNPETQTWVQLRKRIEHGIDIDLTDGIDAPGDFGSGWTSGIVGGFHNIHISDDGRVVSADLDARIVMPEDNAAISIHNMVYHYTDGPSYEESSWSAVFYQQHPRNITDSTVKESRIAMFPNGERFVRLIRERTTESTSLVLQTWEFNPSINKWFEVDSQNIPGDLDIESLRISASGRHIAMYYGWGSASYGDVWIAELYQGTWVQMGRLLGKAIENPADYYVPQSSIKLSADGLRAAVLTRDGLYSKTCTVYQYSGDNRQVSISNRFNGNWEPIGQTIYPTASDLYAGNTSHHIPTSSIAMDGSGNIVAMTTIHAYRKDLLSPAPEDALAGAFHVFELTNSAHAWVDSDADGIPDWRENGTGRLAGIYSGTDPNNRDSDGDGVPDGAELDNGTNPNLADTDGDGTNDRIAINLGLTLPNIDRNQNGFSDFFEQRFRWFNPNQDSSWIDLDFLRELGVFGLEEVNELKISSVLERAGDGSRTMRFRFQSDTGNSMLESDSSISLPTDMEARSGFYRVQLPDTSTGAESPLVPQNSELDSDGDGLADRIEINIGTNPESQDSDSDGLDDYVEYRLSQFRPGEPNRNGNLDFLTRVGLYSSNQLANRFAGKTIVVQDADTNQAVMPAVIESSNNLHSWTPAEPVQIEIPKNSLPGKKVFLVTPK